MLEFCDALTVCFKFARHYVKSDVHMYSDNRFKERAAETVKSVSTVSCCRKYSK